MRKWYTLEDGKDNCICSAESFDEAVALADKIDGVVEIFEFEVYEDGNYELFDCVWSK